MKMTETPYTVEVMEPLPAPRPLDIRRVTQTMRGLNVGWGFVIPATELEGEDGRYLTNSVGQRIHQAARRLKIRVSVKKQADGLRVRREA
jgi:hypothetical protein